MDRIRMRKTKSALRECARLAMQRRGYQVTLVPGAGIVPGARLLASRGGESHVVAVRSSTDREVGLTRRPDGRWATIPRVDQVIIVIPSAAEPDAAEVLSFAPNDLTRVFDAALESRLAEEPGLSPKAPIFLAVDEFVTLDRPSTDHVGTMQIKPQWREVISLAEVPKQSPSSTAAGFIERVRQEFADLHGVDASKVTVEFRITS
jgi:hypothetical protein